MTTLLSTASDRTIDRDIEFYTASHEYECQKLRQAGPGLDEDRAARRASAASDVLNALQNYRLAIHNNGNQS